MWIVWRKIMREKMGRDRSGVELSTVGISSVGPLPLFVCICGVHRQCKVSNAADTQAGKYALIATLEATLTS